MTDPAALPRSPEVRALLALMRWRLAPADARPLAPGLASARPKPLARLAARHSLEGLLLGALEELELPEPEWVEAARSVALPAVAGNLRRIAELHRVLEVLEKGGVSALALKGPALAMQAYGDVSARSYGDVDVLVPPAEAPRCIEALLASGYVDRRAGFGRGPSPEIWHDWGFTAPDGDTLVEMHWSLTSPRRYPGVDSGEAWREDGHTRVSLGSGGAVLALAPEILLPLVAIHATSHAWAWLEFPASVAGLVERTRGRLDWDGVLDRVRRWRVRRITAVALILTGDLFGKGILCFPDEVERELLRDQGAREAARWFRSRLLQDPGERWDLGSPGLWWRRAGLGDSVADRLRVAWQLLLAPTPAEWSPGEGVPGGVPEPSGPTLALRRVRRLLRRYRDRE